MGINLHRRQTTDGQTHFKSFLLLYVVPDDDESVKNWRNWKKKITRRSRTERSILKKGHRLKTVVSDFLPEVRAQINNSARESPTYLVYQSFESWIL
jgi:hypothetical protein